MEIAYNIIDMCENTFDKWREQLMKGYKKSVFKSFVLVTQLGVSVMVPIALCVAIGVLIDNHFGTWWTVPLLFLGMLAGVRNAAIMLKSIVNEGNSSKDQVADNEDRKDG